MRVLYLLTSLLLNSIMFSQVIKIDDSTQQYGGNKIYHYFGEKGQWNPNAILPHLDKFELLTVDLVAKNPSEKIDWIYFEVANPDSLVVWMNIGNDRVSRAHLYTIDNHNQIVDSIKTGLELENDMRPWGEFSFWLPLMTSHKTSGKYLMAFYSKVGNHEFKPSFGTKSTLLETSRYDQMYHLIYTGIMLIMIFYNFILAQTLRDKIYFFYSINLIALYFATTYAAHFPIISIFTGETIGHNYMVLWMSCLFISMSMFTTRFFDLSKSAPVWHKILWGVTILSIINGLLVFILPAHIVVTQYIILLVSLYAISTLIGIDQIKKNSPLAKLFVLAWVIVFIGVTLYFCVTLLGLFYNDVSYYANYISTSVEAAIFSVALGKRYRIVMQKEQETAQLLKVKNEALIMANNSLDSFNYHVSHDLKSVLVNTGSLNKMIKKYAQKNDADKVIAISGKLNDVVEKGQKTIKGFISLGKSLSVADQSKDKVDIKQGLQAILDNNGLEIALLKFDNEEFKYLHINKISFESLFLNLMTNSVKYSKEEPVISIQLLNLNNRPQIIYSDNGIGVDLEHHLDDLFSPFKRVDNDLKQEGTGIGLYLVKRIVTSYDGTIVPSSAPGQGLTYTITFPKEMMG